jgi:hypothetical protein
MSKPMAEDGYVWVGCFGGSKHTMTAEEARALYELNREPVPADFKPCSCDECKKKGL